MPLSTVSAVLTRIGLGRSPGWSRVEPPNRYERQRAGRARPHRREEAGPDRAGRPPRHRQPRQRPARNAAGIGWEYVHVCVDDATRLAYVEVLADEKAATAIGFLRARSRTSPATASASKRC